jgi:hypothetical protein
MPTGLRKLMLILTLISSLIPLNRPDTTTSNALRAGTPLPTASVLFVLSSYLLFISTTGIRL